MSATWPKPLRCCGQRRRPARRSGRRHDLHSEAIERLRSRDPARCAERPRRHARPSRCRRPIRAAQARDRRASSRHQRPAGQAGAGTARSGSKSMRSRRSGTASSRPIVELFDWAEGRGEQPIARDMPVFRPFMLAHPLDETRISLEDYAAEWKWDGIRVQLVHAGGETRLYSRTGDDISGSFPDVAGRVSNRRARRRVAGSRAQTRASGMGRRSRGELQCASATARAQDVSQKMLAPIPPSFGSTTSCSTARGPARAALDRAARAPRSLRARLDPERFDISQLIGREASRSSRSSAPTPATPRSKASC